MVQLKSSHREMLEGKKTQHNTTLALLLLLLCSLVLVSFALGSRAMLSAAASSVLSANSSPPSDHVPREWWTDRPLGDLAAVFPACCLLSCGKISVSVILRGTN